MHPPLKTTLTLCYTIFCRDHKGGPLIDPIHESPTERIGNGITRILFRGQDTNGLLSLSCARTGPPYPVESMKEDCLWESPHRQSNTKYQILALDHQPFAAN